MDNVIFHVRLIEKDNSDHQILIEEDIFEEGLVNTLIEAGIKKEAIEVRSLSPAILIRISYHG